MLVPASRLLVRVLPTPLASRLIRFLGGRSQRPKIYPAQQEALALAAPVRYGQDGRNVAWSWGEGPLIVFVHGWNGSAAQLAPLALRMAQRGYRCVAIDVTGHGSSHGKRTGWRHFIDDVAALTATLNEEVHAYVGHSAGGLGMMAARALKKLRARFYVCICAPSHPFPPIRAVQQRLAPAPHLLADYQAFIARQFGTSWRELEAGQAFAGAGADLMLFYDKADRFVDHTEGDRLVALCRGARLFKSADHGHSKVLGSTELEEALSAFLIGQGAHA